MAPARARPSPFDKHTSASATAISSGFHTVLNMGPQPALPGARSSGGGGGGEWLRGLKESSGMGTAGAEDGEEDDEDSDEDSRADSPAAAKQGKAGKGKAAAKKKAGSGAAADTAEQRKAQNRIAQREFRQRKQQYIRALEGRVELLSSDHDTQVDRLRWALRGLLAENNQLREVVGNLAAFIGEGMIGGPLQKNGMSRDELEALIMNRSEKTMTETWQNWPGATECEELRKIRLEASLPPEGLPESLPSRKAATASTSTPGSAKRKASGDALAAQAKRTATTQGASKDKEREGSAKVREGSAAASTSATASPTAESSRPRMPVQAAEPSPLGVGAAASMPQSLASAAPPYPTPLSHVNLVFGDGQGLGFNGASGPNLWGMTPPAGGAPSADFFRTGLTPGASDSDALLASLFGADAMSTFGASMAAPSPGLRTVLPAHVASPISMASGSAAVQQMGPPSSVPSASPRHFASSAAHSRTGSGASPSLIEAVAEVTSRAMSTVGNGELTDEIERINAIVRKAAEKRRRMAGTVASPAGDAKDGNRMAAAPFVVGEAGRLVGPEELERLGEASAQLSYHMRNFRRNPAYRLPPLLKPSELQQSVPHDPLIDGMPYPGMRDLLIKHQDTLDIEAVWVGVMDYSQLHEGDVFAPCVWEMHIPFFVRFPQLLDEQTLANSNKWRAERGEPTVTMEQVRQMAAEHAAAGGTPTTA